MLTLGTDTSVVLAHPPALPMHANSGSSWKSEGMLREKSVRSTDSGPIPFLTPLTSCSSASVAPRHGVPSVMSLRVTSAPPHFSMYHRATRPPMEWPMKTTLASAYAPPCARSCSSAGSTTVPSRSPL